MKDLKEKAIKIQNKSYVLVSDRIIWFNENYPNGCIKTEKIFEDEKTIEFKATVIPDIEKPDRYFTGHSQEKFDSSFINKSSAMENAETSAVGRALALMGIGVIDSIASVDEINKSKNFSSKYAKVARQEEVSTVNQVCSVCKKEISPAEAKFSKAKYGDYMCRACQNLNETN